MTDYTAYKTAFAATGIPAGVTGTALTSAMTPGERMRAMNGWTIAGPTVDVPVDGVLGDIARSFDGANSSLFLMEAFATGTASGDATHDSALVAAQILFGKPGNQFPGLLATPNAPPFRMSDPATYAQIKGLLDALLAQETASPNSTGMTQALHDTLLGRATGPAQKWVSAPSGAGLTDHAGGANGWDLFNMGLVDEPTAEAIENGSA